MDGDTAHRKKSFRVARDQLSPRELAVPLEKAFVLYLYKIRERKRERESLIASEMISGNRVCNIA